MVVTFGWSLLSGDRYFRVVVNFWVIVTFGWSLLLGGRYVRVVVTFG